MKGDLFSFPLQTVTKRGISYKGALLINLYRDCLVELIELYKMVSSDFFSMARANPHGLPSRPYKKINITGDTSLYPYMVRNRRCTTQNK